MKTNMYDSGFEGNHNSCKDQSHDKLVVSDNLGKYSPSWQASSFLSINLVGS